MGLRLRLGEVNGSWRRPAQVAEHVQKVHNEKTDTNGALACTIRTSAACHKLMHCLWPGVKWKIVKHCCAYSALRTAKLRERCEEQGCPALPLTHRHGMHTLIDACL